MDKRKKPLDKELARKRRNELIAAIDRNALTPQEAVRHMRQISGMTQDEFAAHRGVSSRVIKEIERGTGNPTVNTLNQIGQFFGLEVSFVRSERLRDKQEHSALEPRAGTLPMQRIYSEQRHMYPAPEGALLNRLKTLLREIETIALGQKDNDDVDYNKEKLSMLLQDASAFIVQAESKSMPPGALEITHSLLEQLSQLKSLIEKVPATPPAPRRPRRK